MLLLFFKGAGAANDKLTASNLVTGAPALGAPSLTQNHVVAASNLATAAPVLGTPALGQNHAVAASNLATGAPALGTPALAQNHVVAASNLATAAPVLGAPALVENHVLSATGITTGAPVAGSPALTEGAPVVPPVVVSGPWVVVYGAPVRQFYADAATMATQGTQTDAKHLLLQLPLPAIESALSVDGAQSSSVSIGLRNDAGQAIALLAMPPLGARVEVRDAAGVIFAGRLVEAELSAIATLRVES